jgi:iron complex outermembrane recepter protein
MAARVFEPQFYCFAPPQSYLFMKPIFHSVIRVASIIATAAPILSAQKPNDRPATKLDEIIVTANRSDQTLFQQVQPTTVLKGDELQLKLQPTLGETLNNEPGVSSTSFGPGASRPIIRGLGDDRVRILQNGTSVLDVSNVSPDHAVAADPLSIRSVEIVRGPATLLYGPNTIGGVVNVMDDRIATERFTGSSPTGKYETQYGSVDDLYSQSGAITWGTGPIVFHLDGFDRETSDIDIPGFARSAEKRAADPLPPGGVEARGTVPNSATESKGAGLGGSYIWDGGYLGLSFSGIDSTYGTVGEPDVTIDLRQRRWDLRGASYTPAPWIKEIGYKVGYSDYEHTEFEGPNAGTQFLTEGIDARAEVLHNKIGLMEGAFGVESQWSEFSALGTEAFLPVVDNQVHSLFFFEEIAKEQFRYQFGARFDRQTNESQTSATFGPGLDRDFNAYSTSAAIVYNPVEDYAITASLAYAQRPPTYVELFANGAHVATSTFEVGDSNLGTEDSISLDLSVKKRAGRVTGSVSGYYYRFQDFINLRNTGNLSPAPDSLPIFNYEAVGADFYGAEVEANFHLLDEVKSGVQRSTKDPLLDLTFRSDYVHAENRKTGEPVPRIPPFRFTTGLHFAQGAFNARLEGQYAAEQNRHSADELATDGFFLMNASVSYDLQIAGVATTFYVRGNNLTDEEARQSTSFLKDIAPMAGRGVITGLRAEF